MQTAAMQGPQGARSAAGVRSGEGGKSRDHHNTTDLEWTCPSLIAVTALPVAYLPSIMYELASALQLTLNST